MVTVGKFFKGAMREITKLGGLVGLALLPWRLIAYAVPLIANLPCELI